MAMTPSEKSLAYQARQRAKIDALPDAEREAALEAQRQRARANANAHYARNRDKIAARNSERQKTARREKAEAEGRQFGRLGIDYGASEEDRAARREAKREKKREYDRARYPSVAGQKRAASDAWYYANQERGLARSNARYATKKVQILAAEAAKRVAAIAADPGYRARENARAKAAKLANLTHYRAVVNAAGRRRRLANPEKYRAALRARYWADPERSRELGIVYAQNRRARKLGAGGSFSAADVRDLRQRQKNKCLVCLAPFGTVKPHVDHYMPLALGGTNDVRNLRLLCRKCNMAKHAKDPLEFGRQVGLLCW